jgi:hypothetical protein
MCKRRRRVNEQSWAAQTVSIFTGRQEKKEGGGKERAEIVMGHADKCTSMHDRKMVFFVGFCCVQYTNLLSYTIIERD